MSCCTKTYNLGCFNNCSIIAVGLCENSGTYNGIFTYGNISTTITVTAIVNEPFLFDLSLLNENATFTLAIYDENENQITLTIDSVDYDCFKVKTQVDSVKVTQGTIIGCTPMCKEIYDPNDENTAVLFTVAVDGTTITGDGTAGNPLIAIGGGGGGGIESIVAGDNITIDNTDPLNPIVIATGGGNTTKLFPNGVKLVMSSRAFQADDKDYVLYCPIPSTVLTMPTTNPFSEGDYIGVVMSSPDSYFETYNNGSGGTDKMYPYTANPTGTTLEQQSSSEVVILRALNQGTLWILPLCGAVKYSNDINGSNFKTLARYNYDKSQIIPTTTADISDSTDRRYVTDAELTVIGNTSGVNTGDNAINSLYSGLVSNATHTGEVTGSTALTLDKTAITNKTTVTVANDDYILISDTSDSGNLKKALKSDFGGGGSSSLSGLTDATVASTLANGTNVITWNWSGLSEGTKGLIFGGTDILVNGMTIGFGKYQGSNTNLAFGINALNASTGGLYNTAIGSNALNKLTNGSANTAIGESSLGALTTGTNNIAIGRQSLISTIAGVGNIGIGDFVLTSMGTANGNTAIGQNALYNNILGSSNVAIGNSAFINVKGGSNTGVGTYVGFNLTTGTANTIIGYYTALGITTGSKNTIIGANITGLATSLSNTIILADGDGVIRFYCNSAGSTGIGTTTPNASAKVDIASTTQGVLLPRMTTTQKNAISSPAEGLEVYDLTLHQKSYYNGTTWINY